MSGAQGHGVEHTKASVNIVHIRCQWKLRDIRLERRVPYKGSRDRGEVGFDQTLGSCFVQVPRVSNRSARPRDR